MHSSLPSGGSAGAVNPLLLPCQAPWLEWLAQLRPGQGLLSFHEVTQAGPASYMWDMHSHTGTHTQKGPYLV